MSEMREIDWAAVHARLEHDARILEEAASPRGERVQTELRRRAEALSRRGEQDASRSEVAVLYFTAGGERFALPLTALVGVSADSTCTRVPGCRPELRGVANVRGAVWAVADLVRLLGGAVAAPEGGKLLLLRHEGGQLGLWVDAVQSIGTVSLETLAVPPGGTEDGMVQGVTPEGVQLLRLAALLRHPALGSGGQRHERNP